MMFVLNPLCMNQTYLTELSIFGRDRRKVARITFTVWSLFTDVTEKVACEDSAVAHYNLDLEKDRRTHLSHQMDFLVFLPRTDYQYQNHMFPLRVRLPSLPDRERSAPLLDTTVQQLRKKCFTKSYSLASMIYRVCVCVCVCVCSYPPPPPPHITIYILLQ